jgi:hypothetical protein
MRTALAVPAGDVQVGSLESNSRANLEPFHEMVVPQLVPLSPPHCAFRLLHLLLH